MSFLDLYPKVIYELKLGLTFLRNLLANQSEILCGALLERLNGTDQVAYELLNYSISH